MTDIEKVKNEAKNLLEKAQNQQELDLFFRKYLGKRGEIAAFFEALKNLSPETKKEQGQKINEIKLFLEKMFQSKAEQLKNSLRDLKLQKEKIDVSRPGQKITRGHLHLLTLVQRQCEEIFQSLGFEIVEGPEVENEWYNFDALNIPKDHPARDMWDTFWLQNSQNVSNPKSEIRNPKQIQNSKSQKLLLRTHTSPVQVRYMEKHQPPLKIIVPGRVFRHEATDVSHEIQFYQLEGLMVDKDISAANFKAVISEFFKRFFKTETKIRLRPSFFPFTEPSFEIDVSREKDKWLELAGAGMVHPNVFKAAGFGPNDWQGFAFGMGVDRLTMIKYKIEDIRLFYQNDIRFLRQF